MAQEKIRIYAIILKFEFKINSNFKKTRASDEGLKTHFKKLEWVKIAGNSISPKLEFPTGAMSPKNEKLELK